jgi:hypothetical protein
MTLSNWLTFWPIFLYLGGLLVAAVIMYGGERLGWWTL